MAKTKKSKTYRQLAYKPLLATALAVAGVFNMMGAVLAEGTDAGTPITNTATATYNDGDPNNVINAVSNTVTVNVAEVAGITVTSVGSDDPNGGSVVTDDVVTFDFEVTNTGNDGTFVFVPGANGITVNEGTILRVDIVTPGQATTAAEAAAIAANPAAPLAASIATVPVAGATTDTLGLAEIATDASFVVRVTVEVDADQVGERVGVRFGNTFPNNDATVGTNFDVSPSPDFDLLDTTQVEQNIPDDSETPAVANNPQDVRTVNAGGDAGPVNGEREAAAFDDVAFATAVVDLAQALILKSSTVTNATVTPENPADVNIEYSLELQVGNDNTIAGVDPANLEGTSITLDGSAATRILVSDAIPENTVFDPALAPVAPTGWTVVYTTDDVSGANATNALDAEWLTLSTTPPTATDVTRIGFVRDTATDGVLTPGTNVPGFTFNVTTVGLLAPGGDIANIAQVFGETEGDGGDNVVYDESGDQQFNNLDDGATPTNNTTTFDDANDLGIADVADPDPGNNQGTGNDGESTVDTITSQPAAVGDLFNGPSGNADATGPNDTDDDFTNAVTTVDVLGASGSTAGNPADVTITNTVLNPVGAPNQLDTVTLLPLSPSEADAGAGTTTNYGVDADLPNGTLVTVSFGGNSVQYQYTAGNTVDIPDLANPGSTITVPAAFHTVSDDTTVPAPIVIGTLPIGGSQDYDVTIDLPAGTEQVAGFGVPIAAFVDNDANGAFTPNSETVSNITIDRVYTGFMRLVKEAQIVYAERDGVTLAPTGFLDQAGLTALTTAPIDPLQPGPRPGDEIEYRIRYDNISEELPAGGGGNVILSANDFIITEDGNATVSVDGANTINNWAGVTVHKVGSSGTGTITYSDGGANPTTTEPADEDPANASTITRYVNNVGLVVPDDATTFDGEFIFTREVQ
ncbi:MAG: hypothetical protein AAFV85_00005 [Cyanobacteria bacterium J06634_6]